MVCYHPLKGYRSKTVEKSGKRRVVFNHKEGYLDMPVELACGQCVGCRLERSRQWAIRCVHEALQYENNCFITLTYDSEHVPKDGSLDLSHFQKFIKKLRKAYGSGIRYFHCGEYGDANSRPHYHCCLFNFDFPDKRLYRVSGGNRLYNSDICQRLWNHQGFCVIGDVTFQSAAYVARYIMKKATGKLGDKIYAKVKPPYVTMSRRPGIGHAYIQRYGHEVYKDDFIVIGGKKCRVPRYYDSQEEDIDPDRIADIKISRKIKGEHNAENNTAKRLEIREKIQLRKIEQLKRGFENEIENI